MKSKRQQKLDDLFRDNHSEEVNKFLWIPVCIQGEWMWMKRVTLMRMPWLTVTKLGTWFTWLYYEDDNNL